GAIDLFKSTNSGSTWDQISHWYGGFGHPYVHADQHEIVFRNGSSSDIIFGTDGGVFYTSNADQAVPSFTAMNNGYNVTQYYACAIHPDSAKNQFLAGAQDNGTQRYTSPGMNATIPVHGGDGTYCFIDQNDPDFQIVSSQRANYELST
ncbi:MAG: glycosyl hydrolase, partial [Flavobacteriales bacterium]